LNVEEPWYIKDLKLDSISKNLDIWLDFRRGSKFPCSKCGKPNCPAYDTKEKVLRHINYFQYSTYLHCRVPRVKCSNCGVLQIRVPWARELSHFTLQMEATILELAKKMPVLQAGNFLGEEDKKLWRVIHHYVDEARSKEDFSDVSVIGTDETSRKKGHNYLTIVADFEDSKVIFACEGKDSSTITSFSEDLQNHNGDPSNIRKVCCDMSPSYISGISTELLNAEITFDKFHVMQAMNEAVNEVRIEEQKKNKELKNTKFIWITKKENLTEKQMKRLLELQNQKLETSKAYNIKESLGKFWECKSREEAEQYLKRWYFWATHSRLEAVIEVAKTIKAHWNGILNYFNSRITNGILEGMNSIVQLIKRNARGFKNTRYFINMIYLKIGKLDFKLPT